MNHESCGSTGVAFILIHCRSDMPAMVLKCENETAWSRSRNAVHSELNLAIQNNKKDKKKETTRELFCW